MNLKKNLENHVRGWLPKEPMVYSIKRTTTASKGLAVYFILLFAIGILLRLFITPLFLPSLAEITDRSIIIFTLLSVMLVAVYYLKTQGSRKQIRLFYALAIGLGLGFPIFAVVTLLFNTIMGYTVQGIDLLLDYAFAYTVAFIIGIPLSKKILERMDV